jgi:hypothetical protein
MSNMTDTELLSYYKELVHAQNETITALNKLVDILNIQVSQS